MKNWKLLWAIIATYALGAIILGFIAYNSVPPTNSSPLLEVIKIVFVALGGLGIILPTYMSAKNSIESMAKTKIENTFSLIEKWDDPHLFAARKLTRKIRDSRQSISNDKLIKKINGDEDLRQSVILVFNYFEQVRFSIKQDRIHKEEIKISLGPVIIDIIHRFMPYFKTLGEQNTKDLDELRRMLDQA